VREERSSGAAIGEWRPEASTGDRRPATGDRRKAAGANHFAVETKKE
jgi:hypothetical protein